VGVLFPGKNKLEYRSLHQLKHSGGEPSIPPRALRLFWQPNIAWTCELAFILESDLTWESTELMERRNVRADFCWEIVGFKSNSPVPPKQDPRALHDAV